MFSADDIVAGAEIALGLSEQFRAEEVVSDVRVGLAYGPVLQYEGDLYGPIVNLAHRIVGIAYPGSVVVPEPVERALEDDDRFSLASIRAHTLRDIGKVPLWLLRRTGGGDVPPRQGPPAPGGRSGLDRGALRRRPRPRRSARSAGDSGRGGGPR